jgi:hypothetical protein
MSDDQDLPPWALKQRRPPEAGSRPTWVVVLALAMLVFGGRLLMAGMAQMTGSGVERPNEEVVSAHNISEVRAVSDQLEREYREHTVAVRLNATSKVAMGVLMLFAVAAVFASDARARKATMLAAWLGIAFQFGDVGFKLLIMRKGMVAAAPVLVSLLARQSGAARAPSASAVISALDVFIVSLGVLGVLFSVVLLTFFGGKRGRSFFGVGPRADMVRRQPHHGG